VGWGPLGLMLACSTFFTLDLIVWHRSVNYVGPGLATILANFQVFFLAAFGVIVYKERLSFRFLISVLIGLLGLILIVGPEWSDFGTDYRLGVMFGLMAALAYSFFLLSLRALQRRWSTLSPLLTVAIISLASAGLLATQTGMEKASFQIPDPETWGYLVAYGVMGQVLGWVLITKGISKVDASRVGLILLLQPSLAFLWDILFFSRPARMLEISGAFLAITAIYMGSVRSQEKSG
jgi:drug/metabolite transporter (DMT)-like permease